VNVGVGVNAGVGVNVGVGVGPDDCPGPQAGIVRPVIRAMQIKAKRLVSILCRFIAVSPFQVIVARSSQTVLVRASVRGPHTTATITAARAVIRPVRSGFLLSQIPRIPGAIRSQSAGRVT
jgi:hypothetical protein